MTTPYIFVHIPKTAGSSFRHSLECEFTGKVVCDYGINASETSKIVLQNVYNERDFYHFRKELRRSNVSFLAGHFPVVKYARLFSISKTITFVRNPVERVISEFKHFVRIYGYQGNLMEFAKSNRNMNTQKRYMRNIPWKAIGFIGVKEHYDNSIQLLNHTFGFDLPVSCKNVAPIEPSENFKVSDRELDEIRNLNQADFELYKEISGYFQLRLKFMKRNLPTVAGEYEWKQNEIKGWAYYHECDNPVELVFYVGDKKVGEAVASQFNKSMSNLSSSRDGYVGFSYEPDDPINARQICCRVKKTGQELQSC